MVPQAALNAWAQQAPWPTELDIEQDLILSRAMIEIANHDLLADELAFRGGTSLHKLHIVRPWRYSNDLDYVRTSRGPVGDIMDAVREPLQAMGLEESDRALKRNIVNLKFDALPTRGQGRLRIKIEINTRETEPLFERPTVTHAVDNPWFTGRADVLTFRLEELLGTKLRALYQRRKGRDLFDLWLGLEHLGADPVEIVAAFEHYLAQSGETIDRGDFEDNLQRKLEHGGFRTDLTQLVRDMPNEYTVDAAAEIIARRLLSRLS